MNVYECASCALRREKNIFLSIAARGVHNNDDSNDHFLYFETGALAQLLPDHPPPGENRDAVEGETIRLACRFNPQLLGTSNRDSLIFYWHRTNNKKSEPVAISEKALHTDYAVDHQPHEGKYDLIISQAQYDRDNGHFECKIQEPGSGVVIKSVSYLVTILSK